MSVDVVMPQMGESITEGTITKWLKQVGETIERDEPLLEISTDKVDAEVPAPQAGTIVEIRNQEGETVEVGKVIAVISANGAGAAIAEEKKIETAEVSAPPQAEEAQATAEVLTENKEESTEAKVEAVVAAAEEASGQTETVSAANSSPSSQNAAEVVMPQMGESITEGTISKWLKQVGDSVERDEPLLEISTDKVDAEIPAPQAGILLNINNQEGETVEVGKVIALIGAAGATVANPQPAVSNRQPAVANQIQQAQPTQDSPAAIEQKEEIAETEGRSYDYEHPDTTDETQAAKAASDKAEKPMPQSNGTQSLEELRRTKSSPLVRNIAKEHGVDIARIQGSGASGRVTKKDILDFIDSGASFKPEDLMVKTPASSPSLQSSGSSPIVQNVQTSAAVSAVGDRIEPMSVMRKKIAEKMVISKQTAAHVTSVYEIDMTNVVKFRSKNKDSFQQRYGTKLTFMPFIFQAVTDALRKHPVVNSQIAGDQIIYKGEINLGMAVALDWGLIVPVIKNADRLSTAGLAMTANDLAQRARAKKLNPDEVQNGTFTITNTGTFGGLFGTPIINQPQVAIMCFGTIEKRPKVITTPEGDDVIAVRSMAFFALTYDHRIIDGADAEKFLAHVKKYLETTQFAV